MKELLKGSLILTSSNLVVRFGSYIYRVLMGRMLSPGEFGILNLALPLQFLAVVMASSGIAPTLAKFVAECQARNDADGRDRTISSSLVYFTGLGIAIFIVFYLAAGPISVSVFKIPELIDSLRLAALAVPFVMITAVYTGAFQGLKRMDYMGGVLSAQQGLRLVLAGVLVYGASTAVSAMAGSTIGFVLTIPLAYGIFKKMGLGFRAPLVKWESFREVFDFSVPVTVTAVSSFLLAYVDIILLGYFLTPREVGIYSAASPTSRLVLVFSTALYATILPSVSSWASSGMKEEVVKGIRYSYKISLAVLVPTTAVSIIFSEQIIGLLFGSPYLEAAAPFRVLVLGTAFLGIYTLNAGIFQGLDRPDIPMKVLLTTAFLDILLNILLIPKYQVLGAAMASTASFVFAGAVSFIVLLRSLER